MISFNAGKYVVQCKQGELPYSYYKYIENATLSESYDLKSIDGELLFISVGVNDKMPFLVVAQKYTPAQGGFNPGIVLVPETDKLFIGSGQRVLIYELKEVKKMDEDFYYEGFLGWIRHKNYIIMLGEIDVACWTINGEKLWERFVEPPYNINFEDNLAVLDIMGEIIKFDLNDGPK